MLTYDAFPDIDGSRFGTRTAERIMKIVPKPCRWSI